MSVCLRKERGDEVQGRILNPVAIRLDEAAEKPSRENVQSLKSGRGVIVRSDTDKPSNMGIAHRRGRDMVDILVMENHPTDPAAPHSIPFLPQGEAVAAASQPFGLPSDKSEDGRKDLSCVTRSMRWGAKCL